MSTDQATGGNAAHWMAEARKRVTENPGLEVMARGSFELEHPVADVWGAISDLHHWQADAFHNEIVAMHGAAGVGAHFEMRHTNYPIIPWAMPDQRFMGVIMDWEPQKRQSVAELNIDDSAGSKRTPDHHQIIGVEAIGPARTRLDYAVGTVRMQGISPITRFFFRPWARFQLRRAIRKKLAHIRADLARGVPAAA